MTTQADRSPGIASAVRRAKRRERERCAKLAEMHYADPAWHAYYRQAGAVIATKIRDLGDEDAKRAQRSWARKAEDEMPRQICDENGDVISQEPDDFDDESSGEFEGAAEWDTPLVCPVTGQPCTTEQDEFCEDYGCARRAGIDVDRDIL